MGIENTPHNKVEYPHGVGFTTPHKEMGLQVFFYNIVEGISPHWVWGTPDWVRKFIQWGSFYPNGVKKFSRHIHNKVSGTSWSMGTPMG